MSSGEQSLDSRGPGGMRSRETRNPALWGLAGVLAGSLVSGAFSVVTAQMAFQANENSAARAQQSSERTIESEQRKSRDEFLREQRITVYKQFLTNSRLAEEAQLDYLDALSRPAAYAPGAANSYFTEMEQSHRQFVDSSWGFEFLSTVELEVSAHALTQELYTRQEMLRNYNSSAEEFQALTARIAGGRNKMAELRDNFTASASKVLSS